MAHKDEADGAEKNFFGKKDKNMKIKKLLAGIMSAVMVLGIMTFPTFAEETTEEVSAKTHSVSSAEEFTKAITDAVSGDIIEINGKITPNGNPFELIKERNLTFVGKDETAELYFGDKTFALHNSGTITFKDLIMTWGTTDYRGFQHANILVYDNCTINGKVFLYGVNETFNKCKFVQTKVDYNVWTYGAGVVSFNDCEFSGNGKAVLIYNEGSITGQTINVTNCKFEAFAPVEGKAAIEIDSHMLEKDNARYTVNIDDKTKVTGFGTGSTSGNSLYNVKKFTVNSGEDKSLGLNVSITVNNQTVEAVSTEMLAEKLKEKAVAQIGDKYYASLVNAVAAAQSGDTVTLLCDANGDGIKINESGKIENLTIDFGGHTYTVDGVLVGSPGTETNGFQLLKDSNIVFKNGKLYTNKAYILVQNYSNLTLENMDLNLETVYTKRLYTLSNNNGDTILKGNTNISALEGNVAFDVCKYADYPGVSVTLDESMTGTINGNVEVDGKQGEGQKFDLKIKNGTINGKIKPTQAATNYNISISGGTFSEDVSKYCAEGCTAVLDETTGKYTIEKKVAKIGETEYETLQEAINAAGSNDVVTLLCDTTESVEIGADKDITLDLNGKTLANVGKEHTITNNGKLTVTDSSDSKLGVVDNVSHGKAALVNAEGATAVLNGGKFLRSAETGIDQDTSGGNSYYTIQNLGNMGINSGVTVENSGKYSSMITNGYYDISKIKDPKAAILTISGGNFRGGLWAVKNDDMAVMKINDGYFESHGLGAFLNNNVVEINGGTFVTDADKPVLRNVYYNNTYNLGTAKITNGNFTGKFVNVKPQGNISISGGTFSTNVSEYCVDGFKAVKGADGRYTIEEANWGKYTDSGCYVVNDTKYGMMRFMFAFTGDITGKTVQSYGIKYISAENIGAELNENGAVSQSGNYTAFQGDIVGIDYDTTNKANYYAAAYIKFDDNTVIWSAPQKCKINWNRTFTKYAPQTSGEGDAE